MRGNIFYFYLFQFFLVLSVSLFLDVRYCWYCIALTERMNIGFTANNTNTVTTIPLLKKGGCFTHSTRFSCVPFGLCLRSLHWYCSLSCSHLLPLVPIALAHPVCPFISRSLPPVAVFAYYLHASFTYHNIHIIYRMCVVIKSNVIRFPSVCLKLFDFMMSRTQ